MAYRRSDFAFPGSRLEKGYSISAAMLARKGLKELTLGRDLRVRVRNGKGRMSRTGSRSILSFRRDPTPFFSACSFYKPSFLFSVKESELL